MVKIIFSLLCFTCVSNSCAQYAIGDLIAAEVDLKATPGPWIMLLPERGAEYFDTLCGETSGSEFVSLSSGHRVEKGRCDYGASSSKGLNTTCRIYTGDGKSVPGTIRWLSNTHVDCGDSVPAVVLSVRRMDVSTFGNIPKTYLIARCPGFESNPKSSIGLKPGGELTERQKKLIQTAVDQYMSGLWAKRFVELKDELNVSERVGAPLDEIAKVKSANRGMLTATLDNARKHLKVNWTAQSVVVSTANTLPAYFVKAGWEIPGACVSQAHLLVEPKADGGSTTKILMSSDSISLGQALKQNCAEWSRAIGDVLEVVDSDNDGFAELLTIQSGNGFEVRVMRYSPTDLIEEYSYSEDGC